MKNILKLLLLLVLVTSCSSNEIHRNKQSAYLRDIGVQALELNTYNLFNFRPSLQNLIKNQKDEEVLLRIMDVALTVDSLAMHYMDQSGGITEDGFILESDRIGEIGVIVYDNYNLRERLRPIFLEIKNLQSKNNEKLSNKVAYIVGKNFFEDKGNFSSEKLRSTPLVMISLELSLIENGIYSLILQHISENGN